MTTLERIHQINRDFYQGYYTEKMTGNVRLHSSVILEIIGFKELGNNKFELNGEPLDWRLVNRVKDYSNLVFFKIEENQWKMSVMDSLGILKLVQEKF